MELMLKVEQQIIDNDAAKKKSKGICWLQNHAPDIHLTDPVRAIFSLNDVPRSP